MDIVCKYCGRSFNNKSHRGCHELYCYDNPSRKDSWNKGLKDDLRCKHTEATKAKLRMGTGKAKSEESELERCRKIKEASKNNGGYRKGSGRSKHGWYKNIWCDSSWELAWVIFNIDHGISFERNHFAFEYEYEGNKKKYYPDFKIDNTYIEIKGYFTEQTNAKVHQFPGNLVIIDKYSIQKYLSYAKEKYGKDFVRMYNG